MARGMEPVRLQERIGYVFHDLSLLETALTHSSFVNECRHSGACGSNERMEFLGDAVLQIYVSEYLYTAFPALPEGELTKFRQHLVCEGTLAALAEKAGLGDYLILGKGEEQNGGRRHVSILADAFEALLAAIYLDSNNDRAQITGFLFGLLREEIEYFHKNNNSDYKTRLQQLVQQDGHELLRYDVISEQGPDHNKTFTVHAMLNSNCIGCGTGRSKREAEQMAAKEALALFGQKD